MFIVWVALAVLAVVLMGIAAFMAPARRYEHEPVRFRVHVRAMALEQDEGVRGWYWEVCDGQRLDGSQVVVSGLCVSWDRALAEGLFQRNVTEESVLWKLEDAKR